MPTYFRFLTLMAFHVFMEEGVDVAILEVGIGGEYDATNVIDSPWVCGISSLGFDHQKMLGDTLPEIAWHKAGIMKVRCNIGDPFTSSHSCLHSPLRSLLTLWM